jgi:hypothetical protein
MRKRGHLHCSFTLPHHVAVQIADVAKWLGISQSALLTELLEQPIGDMRKLIATVPNLKAATDEQVLRARGVSADIISERVREALRVVRGRRS